MPRPVYTEEQLHFLRAFRLFPLEVITGAFNNHFGTDKAQASIQSAYKNHHIRRSRRAVGKGNGKARLYTADKIAWLREHYLLMPVPELTKAFNAHFETDCTEDGIKRALFLHKCQSGRTGRFSKGQQSWNKGVKGYMGANATSFKKGNLPHNHKPLWSERIDSKDGYIYISVPETNPHTGFPTRYKQKHVWVWEQVNGPVPKDHAIIFVDSDIYNLAIDNLLCVHRNVLLNLNLHDYKNQPAELKPSILALSRLEAEAGIRTVRAAGAGRKRKVA